MSELQKEVQAKRDRAEANELLVAIWKMDESLVRRLLGTGSNPDATEDPKHPSGVTGMEDGYSALYLALTFENLVIVKLLLEAGANVDLAMGKKRMTVLMVAAVNDLLDAARLFFEFNANPNVTDKGGGTAVHYAVQEENVALTRLLVKHEADLNVQAVDGDTALHLATAKGDMANLRILLEAGAEVDIAEKRGCTAAKVALLKQHLPSLELLLRFGASAHLAAALSDNTRSTTAKKKSSSLAILNALKDQPFAVHLLADHGGICEKSTLDIQMSANGHTQVLRALRQVGCDAWCSGGCGISDLRKHHSIDGTKLLGAELVGHTIEIRLRPSHFVTCNNDPLDLDRGARVVVHGLTSAAGVLLNAKCGKLGGPLGAVKAGRYPVFFKGEKGFKQIKPCYLRSIVDPGRAAVAGHEVDALQSVVLGGATGITAVRNGVYNLNPAHTANGFPVFTHITDARQHLFCGVQGRWFVSDTASMVSGRNSGWICSSSQSPSPLSFQWEVDWPVTILDPAVTLDTPTWLTGSPPEPWLNCDATVESYNEASHEHTLVFHDCVKTTLHLRLYHYQFLDWDVLPRRRAAMLAPRAAMTMMMVMDRVLLEMQRQQLADFALGREKQALSFPPGTPALRVLVYIMQSSTKDCNAIFRENVWKSVAAPPDRVEAGRVADEREGRAAAAAIAAQSGGGKKKKKKKKKKGKKKKQT